MPQFAIRPPLQKLLVCVILYLFWNISSLHFSHMYPSILHFGYFLFIYFTFNLLNLLLCLLWTVILALWFYLFIYSCFSYCVFSCRTHIWLFSQFLDAFWNFPNYLILHSEKIIVFQKINGWDLIQLISFCTTKEPTKMKTTTYKLGEIIFKWCDQ